MFGKSSWNSIFSIYLTFYSLSLHVLLISWDWSEFFCHDYIFLLIFFMLYTLFQLNPSHFKWISLFVTPSLSFIFHHAIKANHVNWCKEEEEKGEKINFYGKCEYFFYRKYVISCSLTVFILLNATNSISIFAHKIFCHLAGKAENGTKIFFFLANILVSIIHWHTFWSHPQGCYLDNCLNLTIF